jgi:preprotein translocase subunit SecF
MNLLKFKTWYLVFSVVVLVPGLISLALFGLKLSIDFTGGSVSTYRFEQAVPEEELIAVFAEKEVDVDSVLHREENSIEVRTKVIDANKNEEIRLALEEKFENSSQLAFATVGPAIGRETTKNAFVALAWASVGILLYIAYAFRKIPKPYSSLKFGASAILAMLHDALLVVGAFSILGHFYGIEVDVLFITAVLTVIGFSVHDSIVVFDRIRENLRKLPKSWDFEQVANYSIVETLNRSLATSLTVVFTLLSLFLLGGETIRVFVLALLIGVVSGTYSSIFTATPILVLWEKHRKK